MLRTLATIIAAIIALPALPGCPRPAPVDDDDSTAPAGDDDSAIGDDDDDDDSATGPVDTDGDGVPDVDDACPDDPAQWSDSDGDGVCDEVDDGCPDDPTESVDTDGDGACDGEDDCPDDAGGFSDTNGDGVCDGNDDTDGDGITDAEEQVLGVDCAVSNPYVADTDGDGYDDNVDLYPLDPFPEYILWRDDVGTLDIALSNRDGTFTAPQSIGLPFGDTTNTAYRYTGMSIADFDGNGRTDFFAYGDADPADPDNALDLWWFGRVSGATSFAQRLVDPNLPGAFISGAADLDNDDDLDVFLLQRNPGGYISELKLWSFLYEVSPATASCAWTDDPTNPDGCVFVRMLAIDLQTWGTGLWIANVSRDAVDVDGDGNRDLLLVSHSSGGTSPSPVWLLTGNGDGSFNITGHELFSHSPSPVNSMVLADFDNDDLGDILVGLDDDGDAGSAWFYPGQWSSTDGYTVGTASAFEAFDLNPGAESGGENYGVTGSARSFDFDFDGNEDILLGYNTTAPWTPPSDTVFLAGTGTGSFAPPVVVRSFTNAFGQSFATPQRLCRRFQIE